MKPSLTQQSAGLDSAEVHVSPKFGQQTALLVVVIQCEEMPGICILGRVRILKTSFGCEMQRQPGAQMSVLVIR